MLFGKNKAAFTDVRIANKKYNQIQVQPANLLN